MAVSPRLKPYIKRGSTRMEGFAERVPPFAVIHHVGRRSGNHYRTPVTAFAGRETAPADPADGQHVVVGTPLPWGSDVDWCRNTRAAGSFTLTRRGTDYLVDDLRVVDGDEAVRLVGTIARVGKVAGCDSWMVGRLYLAPKPPVV